MHDLSKAKWRRALVKTVETVEFTHLINKEIWVRIGHPELTEGQRRNGEIDEAEPMFVTNLKSWNHIRPGLLMISHGAVELLNRNEHDWAKSAQLIPYRVWSDYLWSGMSKRTAEKKVIESQLIVCGCGCGQFLTDRNEAGELRRFLRGHASTRPPRKLAPSPLITCGCGCGMKFPERDAQGRSRVFIFGHNRGKAKPAMVTQEKEERASL